MKADNKQMERNYSLDFLRVISMIMIILLHICSHGGITESTQNYIVEGTLVKLVQAFCVVSVNIFVLISAYFLCKSKFQVEKLLYLGCQTWLYSWIIYLCFRMLGGNVVGIKMAAFPITYAQNWFITEYFGMFLLSPILNVVITHTNKTQLKTAVSILLLLTVIWPEAFPLSTPFGANLGYNIIWFCVLYFIAAYIRFYVDVVHVSKPIVIYILSSICTAGILEVVHLLGLRSPFFAVLDAVSNYERYNSLLVLVASSALFLGFIKLQIRNRLLIKIIKTIAPLTFGVYLIHDNPNMRVLIYRKLFDTAKIPVNMNLIPKIVFIAILIFVACCSIDFVRWKLFDRAKNVISQNKLITKINNKVNEI